MKKEEKWNLKLGVFCACIVGTNAVAYNLQVWKMNPVCLAVIALILYFGVLENYRIRQELFERRFRIVISLWAFLFSLMVVVGEKIITGNTIFDGSIEFEAFKGTDIIWLFFYFIIGTILFGSIYAMIKKKGLIFAGKRERIFWKRDWLIYSSILLIVWGCIWLIYFPGIVPGDAWNSIAIAKGDLAWSNHFPVFYTLIVKICINIGELFGNINIGIGIYSFLQLTTMASIIGYMLIWMQQKGVRKEFVYVSLALFTGGAVFGNYSIIMWKDPWFSGCLLLLLLFVFDNIIEQQEHFLKKISQIHYGVLSILVCLLRSNGVFIVALLTICILIVYRKNIKKVIVGCIMPIIIVWVITGPIYGCFLTKDESFVESVGIPIQQMARVVVENGNINQKEQEYLNKLLPLEKYKEYYNPYLVDPLKWAPEFDEKFLEENKVEFFSIWFSILKKNLGLYVEQYLMGTYGFWHIGGDPQYEFVKTDIIDNEYGMEQNLIVERILNIDIKSILDKTYDFIPSGLLTWFLLFDVFFCIVTHNCRHIIPLMVMIGNVGTLLIATPSAFGLRYIYILMIGLPVLVCYPWIVQYSNEKGKK